MFLPSFFNDTTSRSCIWLKCLLVLSFMRLLLVDTSPLAFLKMRMFHFINQVESLVLPSQKGKNVKNLVFDRINSYYKLTFLQCVNLMFLESYMKRKPIHLNFQPWRCLMNHIMVSTWDWGEYFVLALILFSCPALICWTWTSTWK